MDARYTLVPPNLRRPASSLSACWPTMPTIEAALPRLGRPSKQADVLLVLARQTARPSASGRACAPGPTAPLGPVRALVEQGWVEITQRRTLVVALPEAESADLSSDPQAGRCPGRTSWPRRNAAAESALRAEADVSPAVVAPWRKRVGPAHRRRAPGAAGPAPDQVLERVIELRGSEKQRAVLDALRGHHGPRLGRRPLCPDRRRPDHPRKLAERGLVSLHAHEYDRPHPSVPEVAPA